MKMIYILFITFTPQTERVAAMTVYEFDSKQTCEAALVKIKGSLGFYSKGGKLFGDDKKFVSHYRGVCVKK